jgi:hypothetical protein
MFHRTPFLRLKNGQIVNERRLIKLTIQHVFLKSNKRGRSVGSAAIVGERKELIEWPLSLWGAATIHVGKEDKAYRLALKTKALDLRTTGLLRLDGRSILLS